MKQEIKDAIYKQQATEQSKGAIFCWLLVGYLWIIFDSQVALWSWVSLLLFMPGIFIASFVSVPVFLIKNKVALKVIEENKSHLQVWIPTLNLIDFIIAVVAPIIFILLLRS